MLILKKDDKIEADKQTQKICFKVSEDSCDDLNAGYAGKEFVVTLSVCDNPCCSCTGVILAIGDPNERSDLSGPNNAAATIHRIYTDIQDGKFLPKDEDNKNPFWISYFEKNFEKEDWELLKESFAFAKKRAMTNLSDVKPDFPNFNEIEKMGEMVGYTEIFPHAEAFTLGNEIERDLSLNEFLAPGEVVLIDDQYCLQLKCRCEDMGLGLILIRDGKQVESGHGFVEYSYNKGKILNIDIGAKNIFKPELVVKKMKEKYPNFDRTCAQRHILLRRLYSEYRLRNNIGTFVPKLKNISLNGPCSCGSGKKYKRCCGR